MLGRIAVLRGITALALAAYMAVSREVVSPGDIVRASAAYWIVDGLVMVRGAWLADTRALNRTVFLVRGAIALGAGLVVVALPLQMVFGPWVPGRGLLFMPVAALMLAVIGIQTGAGALDVLICREIRRRVPGEWSFALGAAFSGGLALVAATTLVASPTVLGLVVAAGAGIAAVGLFVGAARLGESRAASLLRPHPFKRWKTR